jgi:hypothetical protein
MNGDYYVVKDERGKEVSLLSDKRTDKPVIQNETALRRCTRSEYRPVDSIQRVYGWPR